MVAKKLTAKEAKKKQSELLKKNEKKSLIIVLPYKKASDCSTKATMLAEKIDVIAEREGSKHRPRRLICPRDIKCNNINVSYTIPFTNITLFQILKENN